jgi:putative sigma-54 modulation protein
MRITFRGKDGFVFTKAIESYVEDKLARIENYFRNPKELDARVVCSVYDNTQTVEVTIPTKQLVLRAENSEFDLYAAIDLVVDKLERQIRKHKDKINSIYRHRDGISDIFKTDEELDIDGLNAEIVGGSLVRNKKLELKPMRYEEAAMQMELIDHDFYVFLNEETDKVNIIYRRTKDNDYAVIETE